MPAPPTELSVTPRPARLRQRPAHLKVLLVEDNADTLRYLAIVLKKQGHLVTATASVTAARHAAAGAEFDLLIRYIELPDGTGLELIRELKPTGITGIALSGYDREKP